MKYLLKWSFLTLFTFFLTEASTSFGLTMNLSFLLIYFFIHQELFSGDRKKLSFPELKILAFLTIIGLIEDLRQGYIGPAVISKNIVGVSLVLLLRQSLFHWNETFKGIMLFLFTLLDETIYNTVFLLFIHTSYDHINLMRDSIIRSLLNVPLGMMLSFGKSNEG